MNHDICFSTAGSVELTTEEKEEVESILSPLGVADDELENVYSVLRMAHCNTASIQVQFPLKLSYKKYGFYE